MRGTLPVPCHHRRTVRPPYWCAWGVQPSAAPRSQLKSHRGRVARQCNFGGTLIGDVLFSVGTLVVQVNDVEDASVAVSFEVDTA